MALALCHTIPRDRAIRLVYLLGLIAFTLLLAGLSGGRSAATDGMVWATARYPDTGYGSNNSKIYAIVRGWEIRILQSPADRDSGLAQQPTSSLCPTDDGSVLNHKDLTTQTFVSDAKKLCTEKFLPAGWASTAFFIISCCSLFLFWLIFACLGAQQSISKNTAVFVAVLILSGFPTICSIIGTAIFNELLMSSNPDVTQKLLRTAYMAQQYVNVGVANVPLVLLPAAPVFVLRLSTSFILFIVATSFLCLLWLVTIVRICVFRSENAALKAKVAEETAKHAPNHADATRNGASTGNGTTAVPITDLSAAAAPTTTTSASSQPGSAQLGDNQSFEDAAGHTVCHRYLVDERVDTRVVNDDWQRQQMIWLQRRVIVKEALQQLEQQGMAMSMRKQPSRTTDDANKPGQGGGQTPPPASAL